MKMELPKWEREPRLLPIKKNGKNAYCINFDKYNAYSIGPNDILPPLSTNYNYDYYRFSKDMYNAILNYIYKTKIDYTTTHFCEKCEHAFRLNILAMGKEQKLTPSQAIHLHRYWLNYLIDDLERETIHLINNEKIQPCDITELDDDWTCYINDDGKIVYKNIKTNSIQDNQPKQNYYKSYCKVFASYNREDLPIIGIGIGIGNSFINKNISYSEINNILNTEYKTTNIDYIATHWCQKCENAYKSRINDDYYKKTPREYIISQSYKFTDKYKDTINSQSSDHIQTIAGGYKEQSILNQHDNNLYKYIKYKIKYTKLKINSIK